MKNKVKAIFAVIAIACLIYAFAKSAPHAAHALPSSFGLLAVCLVLYLIHYGLQAVGWHFILKGLDQKISLRHSVKMWNAALIARWTPGPFMWLARLYLAEEYGLSIPTVGFAFLLEFCYVAVGAVAVTCAFALSLFGQFLVTGTNKGISVALITVMCICGGLLVRPKVLRSIFKFPFMRKVASKASKAEIDWDHLPHMSTSTSLLLAIYYVVMWTYSGWMFYVMALAFMPVSAASAPILVASFPGSWIVGFLAIIAPAGIGVREAAMTFMLAPVMSSSSALVLSVWSRILMSVSEVIIVVFSYLGRRFSRGTEPFKDFVTAGGGGSAEDGHAPSVEAATSKPSKSQAPPPRKTGRFNLLVSWLLIIVSLGFVGWFAFGPEDLYYSGGDQDATLTSEAASVGVDNAEDDAADNDMTTGNVVQDQNQSDEDQNPSSEDDDRDR